MLSRRIPPGRQTGQTRLLTTQSVGRPQDYREEMRSRTRLPRTLPLPPSSKQPAVRPRSRQTRVFTSSPRTPIGSQTTRPQLPFLYTTATRPSPWSSTHLRQHFTRLVSTESRDYYRRRISRGLRIGLSFYAILVLLQVIRLGLYQEGIEQRWPTPAEWSWKSRWCLRSATALMHPEDIGKLMTNWPMVAGYLRELVEILDSDPEVVVDDDEATGTRDVRAKSPAWRQGYFQALLGAAKAAENLDGWVTDRRQKISAPREYMVGPSNPRPTPMPAGQKKVPREEDCEPASESPAVFYTRILTAQGLGVGQRVDAALAYADWLAYMGLPETEMDMYQWALDIAVEANATDKLVDRRGVISTTTTPPSENLLRVSTAMGVHHAKRGDLSTALSVFTSVLRARDSSPVRQDVQTPSTATATATASTRTGTGPISALTTLRNMFFGGQSPSPRVDETQRDGDHHCATAALKTYIGEILYATSSRESGVAWTRDAVETAESRLVSLSSSSDDNDKEACSDCLKLALQNWQTMLEQLIARAQADDLASKNGWFSRLGSRGDGHGDTTEKQRWEAEREVLEHKIRRVAFDDLGSLGGAIGGQGLFV